MGVKLAGSLRHKFLRDTSTLQVGAALNSAGNFFSAVALSHLLGARAQGEYYIAIALYSFLFFFLNPALSVVTVAQAAAALARDQHAKAASWLGYLVKAYAALGILVALVAAALLPTVGAAWVGSEARIGWLAALLAVTPLVELPRVVACAGLQAARRMRPLAQIENSQELVRVFLVVVGALVTRDPLGPVIGTISGSLAGSVLAIDVYRREAQRRDSVLPSWRQVLRYVGPVPLTHGLRLGLRLGMVQNLTALGTQILPSLFVQRFGATEWVTYLRIAQRLLAVPLHFMQGISRTALAAFSELAGRKDLAAMCRTYFRASFLSGVLISAVIVTGWAVLPWLLGSLFPADYVEPVRTLYLILMPGYMAVAFSVANDSFYVAIDKLRVGILVSLVGTVPYIVLVGSLAWLYPTVGAAFGLSLSMFWSFWHLAYAAFWFRRHLRREARGAPPIASAQRGE